MTTTIYPSRTTFNKIVFVENLTRSRDLTLLKIAINGESFFLPYKEYELAEKVPQFSLMFKHQEGGLNYAFGLTIELGIKKAFFAPTLADTSKEVRWFRARQIAKAHDEFYYYRGQI